MVCTIDARRIVDMRVQRRSLLAVVVSCAVAGVAAAAQAQTNGQPERFTAMAVNMNAGRSGIVEIGVDRWSSDADRDKLLNIVMTQGPEKLLDALQDMPRMGYLRTPDSI